MAGRAADPLASRHLRRLPIPVLRSRSLASYEEPQFDGQLAALFVRGAKQTCPDQLSALGHRRQPAASHSGFPRPDRQTRGGLLYPESTRVHASERCGALVLSTCTSTAAQVQTAMELIGNWRTREFEQLRATQRATISLQPLGPAPVRPGPQALEPSQRQTIAR